LLDILKGDVFDIKPTEYLFVPLKNGKLLRDSQENQRIYRSAAFVLSNLANHDYDIMQIFWMDDVLTKADFEKASHYN